MMVDKRQRLPMSPLKWALHRETIRAEAQHAALQFARDCEGDVVAIRDEIDDHAEMISDNTGPWAPGASTRIYQDAYLAGLKHAIEIIEKATRC